jgi:chromate transporter
MAVFNGLQTIVVAIVANATLSFGKTLKGFKDVIIAVIAVSMFAFGLSPILVILLAAFLGFILHPIAVQISVGSGS